MQDCDTLQLRLAISLALLANLTILGLWDTEHLSRVLQSSPLLQLLHFLRTCSASCYLCNLATMSILVRLVVHAYIKPVKGIGTILLVLLFTYTVPPSIVIECSILYIQFLTGEVWMCSTIVLALSLEIYYKCTCVTMSLCVLERAKQSFFALPDPSSCSVTNKKKIFEPTISGKYKKELSQKHNIPCTKSQHHRISLMWFHQYKVKSYCRPWFYY